MSAAYAARATRDLSLCSRFDFNIYSYESEWTLGAEWWLRRGAAKAIAEGQKEKEDDEPVMLDDMSPPGQETPSPFPAASISTLGGDVTGVVKARISTSSVSHRLYICANQSELRFRTSRSCGKAA
jgi:distribution and morphology protein 10